jgi:hypothetical protein
MFSGTRKAFSQVPFSGLGGIPKLTTTRYCRSVVFGQKVAWSDDPFFVSVVECSINLFQVVSIGLQIKGHTIHFLVAGLVML